MYAIVDRIDEIIEISSHSTDSGFNPIFIPLTADCFFYLKENSYQFEKLSKYFTNTSQIDCLKFVEKHRDTFANDFEYPATKKEFSISSSFNISYLIFVTEVILKVMESDKNSKFITTNTFKLSSSPVYENDSFISEILRKIQIHKKIIVIFCGKKNKVNLISRPLDYKLYDNYLYRQINCVPQLGYGIKNLIKKLNSQKIIKSCYLLKLDRFFITKLPIIIYYFLFYQSIPLLYSEREFSSEERLYSNFKIKEIIYKEINLTELLQKKISISGVYYKSFENLSKKIESFFISQVPSSVITWSARGVSNIFGEMSAKFNISAICISHGTVSNYFNSNDKIYKKFIAESVILCNFPLVAIQSPIALEFFNNYKSNSKKVITGNLLFSPNLNRKKQSKNKIVYAVTVKAIQNMQFLGAETYDEFIDNILYLSSNLNMYDLVVQVHPSFRDIFKKNEKYFPSISFSYQKISKVINNASCVISYSSTVIEDALNNKIPVILFDKVDRYKHCDSLNLEMNYYEPYPVYYVKTGSTLVNNIKSIIDKKNVEITDWSSHIFTETKVENLNDVFAKKI